MINALAECQKEADEQRRLRCYDTVASALVDATKAGSVLVLDQEGVNRAQRSLFGFNLPNLPFFRGQNAASEFTELEGTVTALRSLGYGKWVVTLDGEATWEMTETLVRPHQPVQGMRAKVKKAALGSYMMSLEGGRGVRVARVR